MMTAEAVSSPGSNKVPSIPMPLETGFGGKEGVSVPAGGAPSGLMVWENPGCPEIRPVRRIDAGKSIGTPEHQKAARENRAALKNADL